MTDTISSRKKVSVIDGTDALCLAVYGRRAVPKDYLGGAEARMLYDAAELIIKLKFRIEELREQRGCPKCGGVHGVEQCYCEPVKTDGGEK